MTAMIKDPDGALRDQGAIRYGEGFAAVVAPAAMNTLAQQTIELDGLVASQLPEIKTPVGFALQAPAANVATVYFGNADGQAAELAPGASVSFQNLGNANIVYVRGSAGDTVVLMAEIFIAAVAG